MGAPGSGTSFISKLLEGAGVEMGNVKGNNKERFYENTEFVDLNTAILKAAGGDNTYPPSEEEIMKTDFNKEIKALIKKYKSKFWGWKDPKTSLTIKKYLPYLEDDVYFICMFRKPKHILSKYRWYRRNKSDQHTRKFVSTFNRALLSAIKEFCEL